MLVRKEDIASEETRYFKSRDVTPLCMKVDYGVQYVGIQSVLSEQVENATSPEHFVKKTELGNCNYAPIHFYQPMLPHYGKVVM